MQNVLGKYLNTTELLEIYARPQDTTRFDVGRVMGLDDDFVLLNTLDEQGRDDGFSLRRLENIVCVQADTQYLKKIARLNAQYPFEYEPWSECAEGLLELMLDYAFTCASGAALELENSGETDIFGLVADKSGEIITIRQIDSCGNDDGLAYVPRGSITRLDCDCIEMKNRLLLADE